MTGLVVVEASGARGGIVRVGRDELGAIAVARVDGPGWHRAYMTITSGVRPFPALFASRRAAQRALADGGCEGQVAVRVRQAGVRDCRDGILVSAYRAAGRPRRDPAAVRVRQAWRVHPATKVALDQEAERTGESAGAIIDRLVRSYTVAGLAAAVLSDGVAGDPDRCRRAACAALRRSGLDQALADDVIAAVAALRASRASHSPIAECH